MTDKTAFPSTQYANGVSPTGHSEGMTLRDYFAAKAMNGMLETAIDWFPTGRDADESSLEIFKDLARDSYAIADAMLKAREQ